MRKIIACFLLVFCLTLPAAVWGDTPPGGAAPEGAPSAPGLAPPLTLLAPPTDPENFAFLYFGDIQVVESSEADYTAWGELAASAVRRHPGVAFALQGGDIAESGIDRGQWDAFFAAAAALGDLAFFPTIGNHESNFPGGKPELYLELFDLPAGGPEGFNEEFYSFDYGNIHVVSLNSWVFSGEQKLTEADFRRVDDWLAADLAASDATWKIAFTHVPLLAVHSDTTAIKTREHWEGIFQKYGVDLCFVGHQHVYSRLRPLTGGVVDYEDGITYIMGNSGQKFYSSADETLAERTIYNIATYQLARVSGDALTVQTFDIDGNELDYVELSPRETALTRAEFVEALWRAAGEPAGGAGEAGVTGAASGAGAATYPYKDVAPGNEAVAWAYERGYMVGYGGGLFGPDDRMSKGQIASVRGRMTRDSLIF
ncbi:MAG: metallophosphoesterase [Peptococcaceae bacterium]|jgi:hypothetical protein|nr:metallophosphoesterase [Peptococcaceae bacterium]